MAVVTVIPMSISALTPMKLKLFTVPPDDYEEFLDFVHLLHKVQLTLFYSTNIREATKKLVFFRT